MPFGVDDLTLIGMPCKYIDGMDSLQLLLLLEIDGSFVFYICLLVNSVNHCSLYIEIINC